MAPLEQRRDRPVETAAPGGASEAVVGGVRRWIVLSVLCITLLLISLDTTVLNVAMPTIVRRLRATSSQLQWTVDAYAVVFAGLLLVLGSLGDRVGRKWIFLAGLAVFAGGSAGSAFSGTPDRLVIARACMGVGAAAIMPSTLSILSNVFTADRDRARAIGIWSGTTGLGVAAGPIVGGWLLAHFWWGSVFLVNVPIALVGIIAAVFLVPNSRNMAAKRPDPVGALLSVAGMGVLLWGIIEAPNRAWTSPLVLGAFGTAIIVLSAFVLWELRCDHPLLPLDFFHSPRFSAAIGAMGLVLFGLLGMFFLLTQWLQFSLGYSPLQTGVRVGPIAVVLLVAAPLSSVLARMVGTKPVVFSGMALIAVGLGLLSRTTVHGTYFDALPLFVLIGFGTGLALAPSIESVLGSVPREEAGVGSATSDTALQLGGALGVAILGTALNIRYQGRMIPLLAHQPVPGGIRHLILGSLGGALAVAQHVGGSLGTELADAARQSFVSGMDLGLVVGSVMVGVASLVVLALLPNRASGYRSENLAKPRSPTKDSVDHDLSRACAVSAARKTMGKDSTKAAGGRTGQSDVLPPGWGVPCAGSEAGNARLSSSIGRHGAWTTPIESCSPKRSPVSAGGVSSQGAQHAGDQLGRLAGTRGPSAGELQLEGHERRALEVSQ
ncbi:MAG TPA: MFS transporter [Acidimicrobiales bacterium]|nr:MFS transporter [Acidimicrobiales bacterium]HLN44071.1 MFS transporter [Acidimicrobiales bacterium]